MGWCWAVIQAEQIRDDQFETVDTLGRGNGGEVLLVKHKPTGLTMARKVQKCSPKYNLFIVMSIITCA